MTVPGAATGAIAFLSCLCLVPIVRTFCARYSLLDLPGPLKIHSRPIPRLGGVAIAISLSLGILLPRRIDLSPTWPFFAALILIWLAGLVDDIRGLSPVFRLAAQIAGASMLWYGGWRLPVLGDGISGLFGIWLLIISFANSFNFLDGADGLAAGVACMIAIAQLVLRAGAGVPFSTDVAWALAGASLAFLIFNFPPANFFMGDSGSTTIGFVLAFLVLDPPRMRAAPALALWIAMLPAGLPLLDAGLAILRRLHSGASPAIGDRLHFCDLLFARGISPRKVALICYGITAIFSLASWLVALSGDAKAIALSAILVGGFLILEWQLGSLRVSEAQVTRRQVSGWRLPNLFGSSR